MPVAMKKPVLAITVVTQTPAISVMPVLTEARVVHAMQHRMYGRGNKEKRIED